MHQRAKRHDVTVNDLDVLPTCFGLMRVHQEPLVTWSDCFNATVHENF